MWVRGRTWRTWRAPVGDRTGGSSWFSPDGGLAGVGFEPTQTEPRVLQAVVPPGRRSHASQFSSRSSQSADSRV